MVAKADRAFREPGITFPGLEGLPVWDGNPEIFEVDPDALGLDDFDLFAGQPVAAAGPLSFAFGDYQVWPTSFAPGTAPTLLRPVRERAAGELTIATQNIERFFDDQDDPEIDDPVLTAEEYQARLGKVSGWARTGGQGRSVWLHSTRARPRSWCERAATPPMPRATCSSAATRTSWRSRSMCGP